MWVGPRRMSMCVCVCRFTRAHVECVCVRVCARQSEREQRNIDKRSSVVYRQVIAIVESSKLVFRVNEATTRTKRQFFLDSWFTITYMLQVCLAVLRSYRNFAASLFAVSENYTVFWRALHTAVRSASVFFQKNVLQRAFLQVGQEKKARNKFS